MTMTRRIGIRRSDIRQNVVQRNYSRRIFFQRISIRWNDIRQIVRTPIYTIMYRPSIRIIILGFYGLSTCLASTIVTKFDSDVGLDSRSSFRIIQTRNWNDKQTVDKFHIILNCRTVDFPVLSTQLLNSPLATLKYTRVELVLYVVPVIMLVALHCSVKFLPIISEVIMNTDPFTRIDGLSTSNQT